MLNDDRIRSKSHGLTQDVLEAQAECIGAPLTVMPTTWNEYESSFIEALKTIKQQDINAGVFGDIDFLPHLEWEEKVCQAVGMTAYLPLWKMERRALLSEFLDAGFEAMIVTLKKSDLDESFLGQMLSPAIIDQFVEIGIDPCGENGEYHTVVTNGPIFKSPLNLTTGEIVERSGYAAIDVKRVALAG